MLTIYNVFLISTNILLRGNRGNRFVKNNHIDNFLNIKITKKEKN